MKDNAMGFNIVEGAFVVTLEKGVWRQVDLFEREGKIFAKQKGGFIALMNNGTTSVPTVKWHGINGLGFKKKSAYGVLEVQDESL